MLALQAAVKPAEIAIGQALLSFTQLFGLSIFIVIGNTILGEVLKTGLAEYAPNVDAQAVIEAGATAYRKFVAPADIPGVALAYARADASVFYLAAGLAVAGF